MKTEADISEIRFPFSAKRKTISTSCEIRKKRKSVFTTEKGKYKNGS
jgi:hypothetical protein